jgi:molybdopterin-guanine dinucleotide biosynthesis protein A
VLLAGGLARRMEGACKPLLDLRGRRLIDRIVEPFRTQDFEVVVNVCDPTEAAAPFADLGLPLLADALPGHAGPLAGILGALDFAARRGFDAVLSLPCDTPFLPNDLAERLAEGAATSRESLACAASGGRIHPVVALWPVRLRDDLRRALMDEGLRAIGQFQRRHDCAVVDWPIVPRDPFFNVNTPADLAEAEKLLGLDP